MPLPLSPPPIILPRADPSSIALPLSPPIRFDRLTDMSNASFVSRPQDSTHNERENSKQNHEPVPSKPISEPKKDDERKYISIRELFDDDGMEDARNRPIPPEVLDYVKRNPPNPDSIWYPDWYRYPELRHLIPTHTWVDSLPPPSIPQRFPINDTQHQPRSFDPPPAWPQQPFPRKTSPYATLRNHPLYPAAPASLTPQTTFEILFATLTIGLKPSDIRSIFRYRWRSLPHTTYLSQLHLLDDLLDMLKIGAYEWSQHAFKTWEGREDELQAIEDRLLRELEMAQIGVIGDGRKMRARG